MTARYRVHKRRYADIWYVTDRVSGITTNAGATWAGAIRNVAGRYARLARAAEYAGREYPDRDEIIYSPGGWANG